MSDLAKKLQIKPGTKARTIGAPKGMPIEAATAGAGRFDVVIAFAKDRAAVSGRFDAARAALRDGGILWMAYPKKTSALATDLTRDHGWEPLSAAGFAPVTQIAIDDTWSALRWKYAPALIAERKVRGFGMKKPAKKKPTKRKTAKKISARRAPRAGSRPRR